ncbi:excalibur calcium-binding domain-containing protein [Nocardia rhamnosiphila]
MPTTSVAPAPVPVPPPVAVPEWTPEPTTTVPPAPAPSPSGVYYKNCDAARAAGAAPIHAGKPGYRLDLDRNKDGIACE